jgi:hypothetical protein
MVVRMRSSSPSVFLPGAGGNPVLKLSKRIQSPSAV